MTSSNKNFNQSELEKFTSLANDWWDPKGKLKTLHVINPIRLKYICDIVDIKNKNVLDAGCGGGLLCEAMAKEPANVTGIDINNELIQVAKEHAVANNLDIKYHVSTIEEFESSSSKKYDVITCMEMLEHVPNPISIIESFSKLLNPGGHLIISTINRTFKAYINMIIGAEYILDLVPKKTHHYSQFIKPSELLSWLNASAFELNDIAGVSYVPVLDYVVLIDDPSVNYIVHAVLKE